MTQIAIIRNSRLAYEEHAEKIMWWFDVYLDEYTGSLQILPPEYATEALRFFGLHYEAQLNGRTCLVRRDDSMIRYIKPIG